MIEILTTVIVVAPVAAMLLVLLFRRALVGELANVTAGIVSFIAAVLLVANVKAPVLLLHDYVVVDALGAWTLICTTAVYMLSSIYAVGYMRLITDEVDRLPTFYALFAGFAVTMICGPLMNNIGVYWIAIELTTLVSTFLVGFERGKEAIEAAWKYIIVVSAGISLALLGTVLFYWAGSLVIGPTYDMTWGALRQVAPQLNPALVQMAFLLVLIGFGTKAGLVPMHTWLPDAHSEGPAPVSAMLSGALLNTAMLGIMRFLTVTDAASESRLPRIVLITLGVLSLFIAALFIVRQEGIKRLMAYSSIEHMGILALGIGFGGPLAIAAMLYHMFNHSLNKSLMFFGAGNLIRSFGTKEINEIRGVWRHFPVTGSLWLAGAVGITGAPPFGLFLSEINMMRAGLETPAAWAVFIMLVMLIVIFIGFLNHFRKMFFVAQLTGDAGKPVSVEVVGTWMMLPMWLALLPILVLGIWWPAWLWHLFQQIATELGGGLR